ncbi:hypothetical protein B7435_24300 [Mycolicibacterium peregrinum]|uniref:DUF4190 domain-containing protein n=1 Tax=Mycolicibacterium peregrinum TaxID=43304 RepID=UPI000B4B08FA|nr:DUF4190 domain-containing protein [Mycolicibacterium peregrinum]OWL98686.1 hypothetical protein B7435_24300 [Mycolicibacterium peregrinum]
MTYQSPAQPAETPTSHSSPPATAWAVAALIFGIIGAAVIGIVCGLIALSRTRTGQFRGRGLAIAGLIVSGLWIAIWIITVVAIVTLPDNTEDRFTPAVGSCFAAEPDGSFYGSDVIPCHQPHKVEVFAVIAPPGDQYPGDAADRILDRCNSEFARYAAEDAAEVDIEALHPTAQTWDEGDHTVKCLAVSDDPITTSVKG